MNFKINWCDLKIDAWLFQSIWNYKKNLSNQLNCFWWIVFMNWVIVMFWDSSLIIIFRKMFMWLQVWSTWAYSVFSWLQFLIAMMIVMTYAVKLFQACMSLMIYLIAFNLINAWLRDVLNLFFSALHHCFTSW